MVIFRGQIIFRGEWWCLIPKDGHKAQSLQREAFAFDIDILNTYNIYDNRYHGTLI